MKRQVGRGKKYGKVDERPALLNRATHCSNSYKDALDTRIIILTINFLHDNQFCY